MFAKIKSLLRRFRLSLRMKMTLSILAIAVVLLMSSVISIIEYGRTSNYVSGMISADIGDLRLTQHLVDSADSYNLRLLAVIGDDKLTALPEFDTEAFIARCDSLRNSAGTSSTALADSVLYAYSAYMLASTELEEVLQSDFINTRDWYFTRLQPLFVRLRGFLDQLNETIYADLKRNSISFDSGIYRRFIPSAVALAVGIVLLFLLMYFILAYYVGPIYKMLSSLKDFISFRRRYTYTFDGNDQLSELNGAITELAEDNRQLRKKISDLKAESSES